MNLPKTNPSDIALGIMMPLISRIMCHVRQQANQIYKDLGYDLTPETVETLSIIHHFNGLPQSKLAHILGKDKASVTRILNCLVQNNLVDRVQDRHDRRIIRANITQEGRAVFQRIQPAIQSLSDSILSGISQEDFDTTIKVCTTIVNGLHCASESTPKQT